MFQYYIATAKGTAVISGTAFLASAAGEITDIISQKTPITIGDAIAVILFVATCSWWISRKFAKDNFNRRESLRRLKRIERKLHIGDDSDEDAEDKNEKD